MKHRIIAVLVAAFMLLGIPSAVFADTAGIDTFYIKGTAGYAESSRVISLVNKERAQAGRSPVSMDKDLQEAAMQRAAETAIYFDHTRPDASSCFTASSKAYGENIAAGQTTAKQAMNGWMNSSGHRANILKESYTSIGVGYFSQGDIHCWVQLFGVGSAAPASVAKDRTRTFSVRTASEYFKPYFTSSKTLAVAKGQSAKASDIRVENLGFSYYKPILEPQTFSWSSSNPSVASVSSKGKVTGKKMELRL